MRSQGLRDPHARCPVDHCCRRKRLACHREPETWSLGVTVALPQKAKAVIRLSLSAAFLLAMVSIAAFPVRMIQRGDETIGLIDLKVSMAEGCRPHER